jgi:hypothetical protein
MRERAAAGAEAPREALPFRQRDRRLFDALVGDAAELAWPGALEAVAVRQRDRLLFDAMVARQGGKRVARRGAWTLGAAAFQVVFVTSLALLTALLAARSRPTPAVEVQLVRAAYRRPAPPPPAAPPLAARRTPEGPRPSGATVKARPPAALIRPREIAETMKAPDPGEPMEEYDVEYAEGVGAAWWGASQATCPRPASPAVASWRRPAMSATDSRRPPSRGPGAWAARSACRRTWPGTRPARWW